MNNLIKEIDNRIKFLENTIRKIRKHSLKPGDMNIKIRTKGNHFYYYLWNYNGEGRTVKYVKVGDLKRVKEIAQYDYESKLQSEAVKELEDLRLFKQKLVKYSDVYSELAPARKALVEPVNLPDDEFAERWQAVQYKEYPESEERPKKYTTNRGEKVRSKSELIIANLLYEKGIPYRYEYSLRVKGRIFRPDFVVLNKRTRKEYVWEHLGMADDPDYILHNLTKFDLLIGNGFVLGDNLLVTHESTRNPLSMEEVKGVINKHLI